MKGREEGEDRQHGEAHNPSTRAGAWGQSWVRQMGYTELARCPFATCVACDAWACDALCGVATLLALSSPDEAAAVEEQGVVVELAPTLCAALASAAVGLMGLLCVRHACTCAKAAPSHTCASLCHLQKPSPHDNHTLCSFCILMMRTDVGAGSFDKLMAQRCMCGMRRLARLPSSLRGRAGPKAGESTAYFSVILQRLQRPGHLG